MRPSICCREAASTIIGISKVTETCQMHGRFTQFATLNEKLLDGYTRSGEERWTKRQATSRPDHMWSEIWKDMSEAAQQKEKQKWAVEKTEARQCKNIEKYLSHCSER